MSFFGEIYTDVTLSHRAKSVYMYLRDRSDGHGKCWPGIRTIASDLNISRSTAKRALSELERHGYLEKQTHFRNNGSNTSNLYTIR